MNAKEAQEMYSKPSNINGRSAPRERAPKGRKRDAEGPDKGVVKPLNQGLSSDSGPGTPANSHPGEEGGSKWNFVEKRGKNRKNGLCNPLIFHEIPRNYGVEQSFFWLKEAKCGNLTFVKGVNSTVKRGGRLLKTVDFLASFERFAVQFTLEDLRFMNGGTCLTGGRLFWLRPMGKQGGSAQKPRTERGLGLRDGTERG